MIFLLLCRETIDRAVVYAIETVVIDWSHQVHDVLKKDSSAPLLEGLNPLPFVELEFWKVKAQNLECIYEQLTTPKVRKMAELLERIESSYFHPFKEMFKKVVAGLKEAQDINLHLKPLRNMLEDFEQAEFDECKPQIAPLFHVICLVWAHSKYYRSAPRMVVLLKEICNLVISMVRGRILIA